MYDTLERMINLLKSEHFNHYQNFKLEYENTVNFRNTTVRKLKENDDILNGLFLYLNSLSKNVFPTFHLKVNEAGLVNVDFRVKSRPSISDKIKRYIEKDGQGEYPINKCFNDLFGARIVFDEDLDYETVNEMVQKIDPNLKCTNASNRDYVATHVYICDSNFEYPWELQIWDKKHEESNLVSHENYKQSYLGVEKDYKGGDGNGNTLHFD